MMMSRPVSDLRGWQLTERDRDALQDLHGLLYEMQQRERHQLKIISGLNSSVTGLARQSAERKLITPSMEWPRRSREQVAARSERGVGPCLNVRAGQAGASPTKLLRGVAALPPPAFAGGPCTPTRA